LNAQLWDGSALPPQWDGTPSIDSYFSDGGAGLSEFDADVGMEFSLWETGTVFAGIAAAHGWTDAADFGVTLQPGDMVIATFLGKTAGWSNDLGLNLGGSNAYGSGAYTLWSSINTSMPAAGEQYSFTLADDAVPTSLDFWLNSNAAEYGGTYSIFDPDGSVPDDSGTPDFDHSAFAKVFNVFDDGTATNRSVLLVALEDWRGFDSDFTDMLFAIEIYGREGASQFPVPEPSTYGLIGAMVLMALAVVRRARRAGG